MNDRSQVLLLQFIDFGVEHFQCKHSWPVKCLRTVESCLTLWHIHSSRNACHNADVKYRTRGLLQLVTRALAWRKSSQPNVPALWRKLCASKPGCWPANSSPLMGSVGIVGHHNQVGTDTTTSPSELIRSKHLVAWIYLLNYLKPPKYLCFWFQAEERWLMEQICSCLSKCAAAILLSSFLFHYWSFGKWRSRLFWVYCWGGDWFQPYIRNEQYERTVDSWWR